MPRLGSRPPGTGAGEVDDVPLLRGRSRRLQQLATGQRRDRARTSSRWRLRRSSARQMLCSLASASSRRMTSSASPSPSETVRSSTSSSFGSRAIPWATATSARSQSARLPQNCSAHSSAPTRSSAAQRPRVCLALPVRGEQRQRDVGEHRHVEIRHGRANPTDLSAQQPRAPPLGETPEVLSFEADAPAIGPLASRPRPAAARSCPARVGPARRRLLPRRPAAIHQSAPGPDAGVHAESSGRPPSRTARTSSRSVEAKRPVPAAGLSPL